MFSNNKKVKIGAVELMVELIDWTKINEKISQATGKNVEVRSTNGLIKTVHGNKEPNNIEYAIIDNECCGTVSEWRNMYIPTTDDNIKIFEDVFTCRIFQGVEFYEILEDKTKRAIFPAYSIDMSLETILECLTGEKQPLYVYMGSRYSYNDRLQENESKTLDKFVVDTDIQKHEYSDITVG